MAQRNKDMIDYSKYEDYGQYLEEVYEEFIDKCAKEYEQQSEERQEEYIG